MRSPTRGGRGRFDKATVSSKRVVVGQREAVDAEVCECLRGPGPSAEVEDPPRRRLAARGDAALEIEDEEVGLPNEVDELRREERARGLRPQPLGDPAPEHRVAPERELHGSRRRSSSAGINTSIPRPRRQTRSPASARRSRLPVTIASARPAAAPAMTGACFGSSSSTSNSTLDGTVKAFKNLIHGSEWFVSRRTRNVETPFTSRLVTARVRERSSGSASRQSRASRGRGPTGLACVERRYRAAALRPLPALPPWPRSTRELAA